MAPLVNCRCSADSDGAASASRQQPGAHLVLDKASIPAACSQSALISTCASQLTATVSGSAVSLLQDSRAAAADRRCGAAAAGVITGPQTKPGAAVVFPWSPVVGVVSSAANAVTIDLGCEAAAAVAVVGKARDEEADSSSKWLGCRLRFSVLGGSFLGVGADGAGNKRGQLVTAAEAAAPHQHQ